VPQLAKGGKHVFGWSRVRANGRIVIPPEALAEYCLAESQALLLLPGSRTSGGFGLGAYDVVAESKRGAVLDACPELKDLRLDEGELVEWAGKPYSWVRLREGGISVPPRTLACYGVTIGDKLMVARGSGLAVGFVARGPLLTEGERHTELLEF
jgi:hypothetical protein